LFCATSDLLRVTQMESLLKHSEVGLSAFIKTNHLAVYQRRLRETFFKRGGNLGKPRGVIVPIAAKKFYVSSIKAAQNTLAIKLRLEDPFRIVERVGDQSAEHRSDESRERTGL
jgi:hypothetical protein